MRYRVMPSRSAGLGQVIGGIVAVFIGVMMLVSGGTVGGSPFGGGGVPIGLFPLAVGAFGIWYGTQIMGRSDGDPLDFVTTGVIEAMPGDDNDPGEEEHL